MLDFAVTLVLSPIKRSLFSGQVESECCGSVVTGELRKNSVKYLPHKIVGASFYVDQVHGDMTSPPNRISDLEIVGVDADDEANIVSVQWTAPGGDWNYGSASEYLLACSPDTDTLVSLLNNNSSMCDLEPGEYGTRESCQVSLSLWDTSVFCAIQALDTEGNR